MKHGILLHESHDDVGVAVRDLKKGETIGALTLEGKRVGSVRLRENVPLGHKVAMRDLPEDKSVIKYGRPVGRAVRSITRGAHVHVHNVKTLRWSSHHD
jgi:(2R)-sulfolactate sulfo-lyase subunit alpha